MNKKGKLGLAIGLGTAIVGVGMYVNNKVTENIYKGLGKKDKESDNVGDSAESYIERLLKRYEEGNKEEDSYYDEDSFDEDSFDEEDTLLEEETSEDYLDRLFKISNERRDREQPEDFIDEILNEYQGRDTRKCYDEYLDSLFDDGEEAGIDSLFDDTSKQNKGFEQYGELDADNIKDLMLGYKVEYAEGSELEKAFADAENSIDNAFIESIKHKMDTTKKINTKECKNLAKFLNTNSFRDLNGGICNVTDTRHKIFYVMNMSNECIDNLTNMLIAKERGILNDDIICIFVNVESIVVKREMKKILSDETLDRLRIALMVMDNVVEANTILVKA